MQNVEEDSDDFVRALARGLAVIETFDRQHPALTLTEVAHRAGITRATARRLLLTLTTLGYVSQTGRHFALKPRVLRLGLAKDTAIKVFEVMPSLVDTEATKDMGGHTGMAPGVVAETMAKAIEVDQYEIYVGETARQRAAYLSDPLKATEEFNQGF